MTKKIEELLNLQPTDEEPIETPKYKQINSVDASYKAIAALSDDLPKIKELVELNDHELDLLSKKAEDAYDNLMDLGMNVEVRYASRIFEVASSMMSNAISAKTAKMDKRMKAVDLQLKKLKLDRDVSTDEGTINGHGYVIADRNELLKKLGKKD